MITNAAHGMFAVEERPPVQTVDNPRGVRHIGKTEQDRLPVGERQRVKEANKRAAAMKETA